MWQEDLAILRYLEGPLYRARRDGLLASRGPELAEALEQAATSPDPRRSTTARILRGWITHRPLFEEVLADLDAVDPVREGPKAGGIAAVWDRLVERATVAWGADILPLCWEGITHLAVEGPEWRTVAFLKMVAALPDAASIEPVIACLEAAPTYALADACAAALRRLPQDVVLPRAEGLCARHDEKAGLYQRIVRAAAGHPSRAGGAG